MQPVIFQLDKYQVTITFKETMVVKPASVENVRETICRMLGTTTRAVRGKSRQGGTMLARLLICWALDRYCGLTKKEIGNIVNRNHGSVRNAIQRIDQLSSTDKRIKSTVAQLALVYGGEQGAVGDHNPMHKLQDAAQPVGTNRVPATADSQVS